MTTTQIVTRTDTTPVSTSNPTPDSAASVQVATTTVDQNKPSLFGNSLVPYMKPGKITLAASRMRPEKQVNIFFSDKDVSRFVQIPNIIEVSGDVTANVTDVYGGHADYVIIGSSRAKVITAELDYRDITDDRTIFTRLYVTEFTNNIAVTSANTLSIINSYGKFTTKVNNYIHFSDVVRANSNTTQIQLSPAANSTIDNYYVGNTITIVSGINAGKSANIVSYNAATRTALVSPNNVFKHSFFNSKPNVRVDSYYTIGDYRAQYNANISYVHQLSHFVSPTGFYTGILHVPDPLDVSNTGVRLAAGHNLVRIIDNRTNDISAYTTRAEYLHIAGDPDVYQTQVDVDSNKLAPDISGYDIVASTPGTPKINKQVLLSSTSTGPLSLNDPCKLPIKDCNLNMAGGCFVYDASSAFSAVFKGGYLAPNCIPRWRYTDANGVVIKGFPNRQYSDSSIQNDAVRLGIGGAANYAALSPNWTAGYHPITRNQFATKATDLDVVPFPVGTYIQYWAPETNGWGETQDVSYMYPSDVFCISSMCQPRKASPLAQSFFVAAQENKSGIFVSSIELYFKSKGTLPVEVQLRTMKNGFPNNKIISGAVASLQAPQVKISNAPTLGTSAKPTKFTFPSPVYLPPGFEYCFVVYTDDWGYNLYSCESGKKNLFDQQLISKKKYTGSMFKSHNGVDWHPFADEDVTFVINKCNFSPGTGTVYFEENKHTQELISQLNYPYDSFHVQSDAVELSSTKLTYSYKTTSNTSYVLDGNFQSFRPESTINMTEKKVLLDPANTRSAVFKVELSTTNPDVSPVIFHQRQNLILLNNKITPSGIPSDKILVANGGSGYDVTNTFVRIDSGVYSVNANAYPVISGGAVTGIVVDNLGRGYFANATVSIIGGDNNAVAIVNSEVDQSGGTASTRYISKTVTLLDGFDAGDLRVFVDAIKPQVADIQVYYKVRNLSDRQSIDNRKWTRMVQSTSPYLHSVSSTDMHEYEFRPSMTSNNITYSTSAGTFKTFNQFAIKIVLFSEGTLASQIPYVHDVRAVALPGDAY